MKQMVPIKIQPKSLTSEAYSQVQGKDSKGPRSFNGLDDQLNAHCSGRDHREEAMETNVSLHTTLLFLRGIGKVTSLQT